MTRLRRAHSVSLSREHYSSPALLYSRIPVSPMAFDVLAP
jgi:hypothetical protein